MLCAAVFGVPSWRCAWVTFASSGLWVCQWCEWWTPSSLSLREKHAGSSTFAWENQLSLKSIDAVMDITRHEQPHCVILWLRINLIYIYHTLKSQSIRIVDSISKYVMGNTHIPHTVHRQSRQVRWCVLSVKTIFERKSPAISRVYIQHETQYWVTKVLMNMHRYLFKLNYRRHLIHT